MLIKINIKSFFKIAGTAAKSWWAKDPFMQSSVIAYYAIFSIPGMFFYGAEFTRAYADHMTGKVPAPIPLKST